MNVWLRKALLDDYKSIVLDCFKGQMFSMNFKNSDLIDFYYKLIPDILRDNPDFSQLNISMLNFTVDVKVDAMTGKSLGYYVIQVDID